MSPFLTKPKYILVEFTRSSLPHICSQQAWVAGSSGLLVCSSHLGLLPSAALEGPAGDPGWMLVAGLFISLLPPWMWKRDERVESEDGDKISVNPQEQPIWPLPMWKLPVSFMHWLRVWLFPAFPFPFCLTSARDENLPPMSLVVDN